MGLNKGEWSEVYTFLKLLADAKLYAADAELNKIPTIYYPILKILREEPDNNYEFCLNSQIKVCDEHGDELLVIPIKEFKDQSLSLLHEINKVKSDKGTFDIPDTVNFLQSIKITKLKAKSREKKDITITVHDMHTGLSPTLGFSIKSYLGGSSTLINASQKTNFLYEIKNTSLLNISEINRINSLLNARGKADIKGRVGELYKLGCSLHYYEMDDKNFKQNLTMIDSFFPSIIAEALKIYYKGNATKLAEIIKIITDKNPCGYDITDDHPFYEYKIKNYITDAALGMTPGKKWTGKYDANGGYIIVKEDGDLVCYHIYNRNEFQEYLIKNTKLDTPSSTRNKFGEIYEENNTYWFKLNLQIRFI